ncbi:HpcH/HpaI aldolase/citrate lyase family protein [Salinisphaera aquimarina]|uniref:HpcH/HpaI aldolase/citrate lyase family protein n=1 Tax=Salinisphaera aquimarina TaxID=2094031 RepID=A0ABV7EP19_9GAMM
MTARTTRFPLFVPATSPALIPKALASAADTVIVDLEDAVALDRKDEARDALAAFLQAHPDARVQVRINTPDSGELDADLALCERLPGIASIMAPKAESRGSLERIASLGKPVLPLLETPAGLLALAELTRVAGVERYGFGALDFAFEAGLTPDSDGGRAVLDHARYELLMHSHAAGLSPPLESVFPDFRNTERLYAIARRASDMGFGGMLCIHPAQIETVRKAFLPSDDEFDWAQRVMDASRRNEAAFQIDGQMVDAPVLARARRILALS